MIRPSVSDFKKKYKKNHIIPLVKEINSDFITPVECYYAIGASYLLESAEKGLQVGRYSFLGVDVETKVVITNDNYEIHKDGSVIKDAMHNPVRIIGELLKAYTYSYDGDISPFPGGAVGYIGYEATAQFEKITFNSSKPSIDIPDSIFVFTRNNIVFDNLMHTIKIICNIKTDGDPDAEYKNAEQEISRIEKLIREYKSSEKYCKITSPVKSAFSKEKFLSTVEKIKQLIYSGEATQVVLSQQLYADFEGDPFAIYRSLRSINPSPYMVYLDFGDFSIFGASPELMVKVEKNKAVLRPIAGTRKRGATPEEDLELKNDLLSDEKEKSEHLMLVDLARNDLGRIAKPGTVALTRYMDVEMYSHVMHIVSEVTAELSGDVDVFDVIKAVFPAGTVSGAPKVRAMQIIDELEPVKRNHYAGLMGYFSYTGAFDSCITIRSAAAKNNRIYMQAGAGIVYDSVPEKEYTETLNKAKAVMKALTAGRE